MQTHRITSCSDPLFEPVWTLYMGSFPLIEQRTPEHQQTALRSPHHHMLAYTEGDLLLGFVAYWLFDGYLYIEHYAINPTLRGGGWGSRILREIQRQAPLILLEIDDPVDEVSKRRLHFYERLEFRMNPFDHPLPQYRDASEHEEATLRILTYPTPINQTVYEGFVRNLNEIVMARD